MARARPLPKHVVLVITRKEAEALATLLDRPGSRHVPRVLRRRHGPTALALGRIHKVLHHAISSTVEVK